MELMNRYAASSDRQYQHERSASSSPMQDHRVQPHPSSPPPAEPPAAPKGTQQPSENKGPQLVPPPPPCSNLPGPSVVSIYKEARPASVRHILNRRRILKFQEDTRSKEQPHEQIWKIAILMAIIVGSLGFLAYSGLQGNTTYYKTITELRKWATPRKPATSASAETCNRTPSSTRPVWSPSISCRTSRPSA